MSTLHRSTPGSASGPAPTSPPRTIYTLLDTWVGEGLIEPAQAERIKLRYAGPVETPAERVRVTSLVVEALGYVGGVIAVVAAMLIAGRYWDHLSTAGELALVGGTALVLAAAATAVPTRAGDAGARLRQVLMLASTIAAAGFFGLLFTLSIDLGDHAFVAASAATTAYAGTWFALRHDLLAQIAMMVGLAVTSAAGLADLVGGGGDVPSYVVGLGVWGVGVIWLLMAWGTLLGPRWVIEPLASVMAIGGAMATTSTDLWHLFSLATVAAVILLALRSRDLLLFAVGAIGALQALPAAVIAWFADTTLVLFVLLFIGAGLIGLAIWIARHRAPVTPGSAPGRPVGPPALAFGLSGVVAFGVLVIALLA
jgi:hypothetical protein